LAGSRRCGQDEAEHRGIEVDVKMAIQLTFRKTGKEIKAGLQNRIARLKSRLERRNASLELFMRDELKLRSYLIRSSQHPWSEHNPNAQRSLFGPNEISSEEKEEIAQLCRRIFEIEQELHRLNLIVTHLQDDQTFDLPFADLVAYGFETNLDAD